MQVIIFAAGLGRRLGRTQAGKPKVLLTFGGRTLLEWHLNRLAAVGLREVAFVVGHGQDQVRQVLAKLEGASGLRVKLLLNEDFHEGSLLSLAVALPMLEVRREEALLMDGDVLYPTELLRRLLASPHRTALLVDCHCDPADDEPVLVPMVGGRPVDFVKGWEGRAEQIGESVGFFKVGWEDVPVLAEETRRRLSSRGREGSYDEVLRSMVLAGRFSSVDVTGIPWIEIDLPKDVERAETEVWPKVRRFEGGD